MVLRRVFCGIDGCSDEAVFVVVGETIPGLHQANRAGTGVWLARCLRHRLGLAEIEQRQWREAVLYTREHPRPIWRGHPLEPPAT